MKRGDEVMLLHSRSKKWIANMTIVLMILTLIPAAAFAAASTTWSQAAYDNVSETWTPGNIVKYYEGSYVPYRANAEGYVPTGETVDFDLDYMESNTGALGYDQATNWYIGPSVPYSGSPTLYTKADINAYAQATYGHPIIEPGDDFMGADAFTVAAPVELTSGGSAIPPGYTGDTMLRYHLEMNKLGYTEGEATADPGSFIDALMTWYGGDWTIYYEAHLAESGAPNLFEGGIVVLGAGAYSGSSLHVTFSQAGEKSIPLPTNGLAKKNIYVEKSWANINDAEPVTIKLMGQQGAAGTPYVAATITLDGIVDSNTNPEYEAWKGMFYNIPIYYTVGKDIFPITYTVVEDPVPSGFLTPIYGGDAATTFTVYNEKLYGSLTVHKTVETNDAVGLTVPDFSITITGPSYPSGNTKVFNQTNGMEQTWTNLIPGTYTVTESGIAAPWSVDIDPQTYEVAGGANTTVDVTVTNTYTPGSLTVLKTVVDNEAVGLEIPDFSITITGPSYPSGDTKVFNETNGMEQTWENLIPGTYTVTESGIAAPWSVDIDPETFNVLSGENTTVDVEVTNTYAPGSLTVLKAVETNGAVGLTVPDFSITITGPSYPSGDTKVFNETNGMEQTWENLIPGTYTVTESGIAAPWSVDIDPETFDVESGLDTTVDVTVTNTYATGSLTVLKVCEMNGVIGHTMPDFNITITGPSYPSGDTKVFNDTFGMEQTWENLIPGTYTVTESGIAAPWSVDIDPQTFNVLSGEDTTVDVIVTNTYTPGSLTVLKVVDTNDAIGLIVPDFEITITGPSYPSGDTKVFNETNGLEQTWNGLIPGTYTVTEPGIAAPWSVVIDPATYDVESGENTTVDVTVTNEYTTGTITVTKDVVVLSEDPEITVNYTFYAALFEDQDGTMVRVSDVKALEVINSASTSVVFDRLVADKTYYVFETDEEGNIIETNMDGTIVTPIIPDWTKISYEDAVVTLTPDMMNGEAGITNVFEPQDFPLYGSITVNKEVTVNGKPFASNRTFYVALFADKELTELVSEVKALKMNGKISTTTEFLTDIDGNPLEAGTTYYIAETDKDGVPLTGTFEELGFEIDIDQTSVVILEEGTTVNIVNKFKSEEFPLTGDPSNGNFWLFLTMLGIAGAIAPFAFRRKEDQRLK
jgi:hypothetical protein